MGKIKINDELRSIKSEVIKLKRSGVEFIIALGHSGLEMDRRVAREVDGIDAVIGGHSHSYLISGKFIIRSFIFPIKILFYIEVAQIMAISN